ncbi:MAG: glutamate--cysteine ligase, partial [Gammaproteobacteria bacterium]|nr:glutamate--cysteine ligase [Gammaproteobacteria bacterium]
EGTPYMQALRDQVEKIKEPELTPSATMLREMREQGEGFYHFARRMSQQHYDYFKSVSLSRDQLAVFSSIVENSLLQQKAIEASDNLSFDEYLENYFRQC